MIAENRMFCKKCIIQKRRVTCYGDSAYTMLLMLIPFALLYFFMVRPQKKKEQAQAEMRNDIAPETASSPSVGLSGVLSTSRRIPSQLKRAVRKPA